MAQAPPNTILGRARAASVSIVNATPQLGMWQATGTAIAQAPNLTELREPESGGANIEFDAHGHSTRVAKQEEDGELTLIKTKTRIEETQADVSNDGTATHSKHPHRDRHAARLRSLREKHRSEAKEKWGPTIMHALRAFWKFFLTPSGFLITIYFLNIVAWGAMLFFLLLKAAPAMNHPSADDDYSPRKIWLEIDSQILNALFCVTAFGLAPWRFRDLYWMIKVRHFHDKPAMRRLTQQNKAWFRPAPEYEDAEDEKTSTTFTGERAPPTALWKLVFVVDMMVLNTAFQVVLCYYMWAYNRFDRPTWATGTFIALGCGVSALAGLMSWWEGRKVKKIEGPEVKVVEV
ncbi:hypothetical protein FB567DRAFT_213068 [Paraphoma chrysanthemicola]|uniref:Uncharacterized protein n=1 Tax=Paraphoma chrysanthemicola TaxID=798071 RepID=A0A8K0QVG3_9PLEO|nr:hypothetical protein FB567DRAFT_213068 [Paraphoma chrysanthemicola]